MILVGARSLTGFELSATTTEMGMGLPDNRRKADSSCEQEALDGRLPQDLVRELATVHCRNKGQ